MSYSDRQPLLRHQSSASVLSSNHLHHRDGSPSEGYGTLSTSTAVTAVASPISSRPSTPTPTPSDGELEETFQRVKGVSPGPGPGAGKGVGKEKEYKKFKEIWALCLGLWTASLCSSFSATIVANVQLQISSHFRAGNLASWLGTAFLLGLTAMTPLYGRLCNIMGKKRTMLLAQALFFTGTVGCSLAPSMYFILFARFITGTGAGGILSVTAIIISDLVSLADRGLYQGGVNVLFGAGSALGSVLGGVVGDTWGWRWAFAMQVPVILISVGLVIAKVHVDAEEIELEEEAWGHKFKRIDWAGSALLITCISSLTFAASLTSSSGYSYTHPLPASLILLFFISLPLFAKVERAAKEPILPLDLLSQTQPRNVLLAFFLNQSVHFSRLYMQPVYLHVTRGLNGSQTGLLLLPMSITNSIASLYAGWHMRHYKEYKWFQSAMSMISWMQALSILLGWGLETNTNRLWVEMAVGSVGGGVTITSLLTSLIATVDHSEMALAVSAAYLFRAAGQVVGVSIAGSIQQSILASQLATRLAGYPQDTIRAIIQEPSTVIPTLDPWVQIQARLAYLAGIQGVFTFVVSGGVLMSCLCISLKAHRL